MYLVFDIESVVDRDRLIRCDGLRRKPDETEDQMVARREKELCEIAKQEPGCFIPARYQSPAVIVMLLLDQQLQYVNHCVLAHQADSSKAPGAEKRPDVKKNTLEFWGLYKSATELAAARGERLTLVGFNSLGFDTAMMEVCGLEHGADLSRWMHLDCKSWEDPRSHYAYNAHLDLFKFFSGRNSIGGGLNFWSRLIGLPGKLDSSGSMVADMLQQESGIDKVIDYCICDVLNTYGLLIHTFQRMGLVNHGWRSPAFESAMTRMTNGRGKEAESFVSYYRVDGLF